MNFETLKIFCDVISFNSFSRAAEENGVSQSSVSQAVLRLEKHFQVSLIDRSFRPWKLTREGGICHARCREMLAIFSGLEVELGSSQDTHVHEVSVSTIYSVAFTYFNHLKMEFSRRFPRDHMLVEHDSPAQVCDRVAQGLCDLGILSFPPERRELTMIPWLEEEMVAVCAASHRLAGFSSLRVEDLNGSTLVGFDTGLGVAKRINELLRAHNIRYKIALRFDNIEAIKRCVEDSSYIAILPRITLEREIATRSLIAIPFSNAEVYRSLVIVCRKGKTLGPAAVNLLAVMREYTERISG